MSHKSREKYETQTKYFEYLAETSKLTDKYILDFILNRFKISEDFKLKLIEKHRFKPQLRSSLPRLAYEIEGGKNWQKFAPVFAAFQTKDDAFYCFDKILDKNSGSQEILFGGTLFGISSHMILEISSIITKDMLKKIHEQILLLGENSVQAAWLDSNMFQTDMNYYLSKAEGYNFWENALATGSILAHGKNTQLLAEIGKYIGTAYIITNDTYDIAKELEDFRQGKYTLPNIYALENANPEDKTTLNALLGKNDLKDEEKETIRKIMTGSGAISYGKTEAWKLCQKAIQLLENNFPESEVRNLLVFSTTYTQKNKYYTFLEKYKGGKS